MRPARWSVLLVLVLALSLPALASAAPVNVAPPAVGGPATVGAGLTCTPGTWNPSGGTTYAFQWFHSNDLVNPVAAGDYYVAGAGDAGSQLVCRVTATNSGSTTADSTPTASVAAVVGTVTIERYSQTVGVNLGIVGAQVSEALKRNGITVGSGGPETTDGGGAAVITLSGNGAPSESRDTMELTVTGFGTFPASNLFTTSNGFTTAPLVATVASDGNSVRVANCSGCVRARVVVDQAAGPGFTFDLRRDPTASSTTCGPAGGPPAPPGPAVDCYSGTVGANPAIQPGDRVDVSLSYDNSAGRSIQTIRASQRGESAEVTCTGTPINAMVSCGPLPQGAYTFTRHLVPSGTETQAATVGAGGHGQPAVAFTALKAGETVDITRDGVAAPLSTLRVATLRADLAGSTASGDCSALKWFRQPTTIVGGFPIPGPSLLCSAGGDFSDLDVGSPAGPINLQDDRSGGVTEVRVPTVSFTSPMDGESMAPTFTAYADLDDAASSPVSLEIRQHNVGGAPIRTLANVNLAAGANMTSALAPGRYDATWKLSSPRTGDPGTVDTSTRSTQLVIQASQAGTQGPTGATGPQGTQGATGAQGPQGATGTQGATGAKGDAGSKGDKGDTGAGGAQGPAGPQGPQGATGPQGPAGKNGRNATVVCKPQGTKKVKVTCKVTFARSARSATMRLSKGKVVYALGRLTTARGRGASMMHARRKVNPGRYTLTTVVTTSTGARVTSSRPVTLR